MRIYFNKYCDRVPSELRVSFQRLYEHLRSYLEPIVESLVENVAVCTLQELSSRADALEAWSQCMAFGCWIGQAGECCFPFFAAITSFYIYYHRFFLTILWRAPCADGGFIFKF